MVKVNKMGFAEIRSAVTGQGVHKRMFECYNARNAKYNEIIETFMESDFYNFDGLVGDFELYPGGDVMVLHWEYKNTCEN
jgi:hypothetical protein